MFILSRAGVGWVRAGVGGVGGGCMSVYSMSCTAVVVYMTIDRCIPTMPGQSTSSLRRAGCMGVGGVSQKTHASPLPTLLLGSCPCCGRRFAPVRGQRGGNGFGNNRVVGWGERGGEGAYSFAACPSQLTIDHASLSRRGGGGKGSRGARGGEFFGGGAGGF